VTATTTQAVHEPSLVRLSRWLLTRTVRGNATEGTTWGEAMLSELDEATTTADAVRWTVSSLPVAWRERRARRSAARAAQSLRVRVTRRVLSSLAILLVGGFVINLFVATIVYEPSSSMLPTYVPGTRLLVLKAGYRVTGLHYGNVVVVNVPYQSLTGGTATMVKRVVGLPGDAMSCNGSGQLLRNGVVVAGSTADNEWRSSDPNLIACTSVTVPDGDVYVLGDNYGNSNDSRIYGPVPASDVTGRVVGQVWPW
jgi:signal peptidase I